LVVHQRQRLPLGLETCDDLAGIHAGLDDLQGHAAADRLGLLGDEDQAHAALADLLHQPVRADHRARAFPQGRFVGRGGRGGGGPVEQGVGLLVRPQQHLDAPA
jgi:hypothetical protein